MCRANYPDYNTDFKLKTVSWIKEFEKEPDDLMETAMISCIKYCKKFPTIADIREAIRDLQYIEQTKPNKLLSWDVKREPNLAKQAREFVQAGKAKEYMKSLDITTMRQYARYHFPDISDELILKNYNEFSDGIKCLDRCGQCNIAKQACNRVKLKHEMCSNGYVKNTVTICEKIDRRV